MRLSFAQAVALADSAKDLTAAASSSASAQAMVVKYFLRTDPAVLKNNVKEQEVQGHEKRSL